MSLCACEHVLVSVSVSVCVSVSMARACKHRLDIYVYWYTYSLFKWCRYKFVHIRIVSRMYVYKCVCKYMESMDSIAYNVCSSHTA